MDRLHVSVLAWIVLALLLVSCGRQATPPQLTPEATDEPEYRWSQLLSRDAIRPIYEPEFAPYINSG